jgi:hypothetical protein
MIAWILFGVKKRTGTILCFQFSQMDTGYDKNMVKISHFFLRPISN